MFDPIRICEILNDEGVDYVVIGGMATVMHGSSLPTRDLDLVPSRSVDNLDRLGRALTRLGAMIRTDREAIPSTFDGASLAASTVLLNLVCEYGDLDIAFRPAGPLEGFDEWRHGAESMSMTEGLTVLVASLDDIIESKRAANRPKDIAALPLLESLRDQIAE